MPHEHPTIESGDGGRVKNNEGIFNEQELKDLQAVVLGEKFATNQWKSEQAKKFADNNNLDLIELPPIIPDARARYIIARKEKIDDVLEDNLPSIDLPEIKDKVSKAYARIKNLSIAEALKLLYERPGIKGRKSKKEKPEIAVLEGLIFGYKPCDIEYFVKTRYFGEKEHGYEDMLTPFIGNIPCKKCALEFMKENQK